AKGRERATGPRAPDPADKPIATITAPLVEPQLKQSAAAPAAGRLEIMTDHAATLRSLHIPGTPLVLANAWDAASARIAAAAGAPAVATTSAGVSWCLGSRDGDALPPDHPLAHLSPILPSLTL